MTALWPSWYHPFAASPSRLTSMVSVQAAICAHFGITAKELTGECRHRGVAWPRQLGYLACREIAVRSLPRIGRAFGGRDHSSVASGIYAARKRVANDPVWAGHYDAIKGALGL